MEGLPVFSENPATAKQFPALHPALDSQQATVESNRCLNCFDAPCTFACPTHIDVPGFIKRIASGNVHGAAKHILEANVLAASCSRVCPVEILCEGSCVMHHFDRKPIQIGLLQQFAMETFYSNGATIPRRGAPERSQKVACIGAGPASLACAAELKQQGFQATVIDRRSLPGGLNTYGVAEYKLRTIDSLREINSIRELGVEFRTADINDEAAIEALEHEFDAVFLGVGLGAMHRLNLPGGDNPSVMDALEFIAAYKTGFPITTAHNVAVIGAGNTAIDAAVAAKRLGAGEVKIIYRRDVNSISAFKFELQHAKQEGIDFSWHTLPRAVEADTNGKLTGLTCVHTSLDSGGHLTATEDEPFTIPCDLVIPAIGQSPLIEFLSKLRQVNTEGGRIIIDRVTGATSNPKYFAGGDCVNGGREVVDAVADGKRAAVGIVACLTESAVCHG